MGERVRRLVEKILAAPALIPDGGYLKLFHGLVPGMIVRRVLQE